MSAKGESWKLERSRERGEAAEISEAARAATRRPREKDDAGCVARGEVRLSRRRSVDVGTRRRSSGRWMSVGRVPLSSFPSPTRAAVRRWRAQRAADTECAGIRRRGSRRNDGDSRFLLFAGGRNSRGERDETMGDLARRRPFRLRSATGDDCARRRGGISAGFMLTLANDGRG